MNTCRGNGQPGQQRLQWGEMMVEWLDWFFPTIVGNGTLILIVAGAAGWLWLRWRRKR